MVGVLVTSQVAGVDKSRLLMAEGYKTYLVNWPGDAGPDSARLLACKGQDLLSPKARAVRGL